MINHPKFKLSIVDSNFYLIELAANIEFEIEDMKQLVNAEQELGAKKLPVLVLCTATTNTNIHLLGHLKYNINNPYSLADAFVIASNTQAVLGNFYLKINNPERPTKLFNREADALEWLKQFFKK